MKKYNSTVSQFSLKKNDSEIIKVKIGNSEDSANFAKQFYHEDIEIYESVFIILMNRANNTIGYAKISQGGITGTVVDVKIICKYVIDSLASAVIMVHNHPSGNLTFSEHDNNIAKKLKTALNLLDTTLLDSIVVTSDGYVSSADEGLLM